MTRPSQEVRILELEAQLELERDAATMHACDAIGLRVDLREAQQALTTLRSKVRGAAAFYRSLGHRPKNRAVAEGLEALLDETAPEENCPATADSSSRDASSVGDQSPGEPGLATSEYQRARATLRYYRKDPQGAER